MFNLDINFLNDRPDLKPGGAGAGTAMRTGARTGFSSGGESKTPLYAGIAALIGLLGLTALGYGYFTWQKGSLTERQAELDSKLGSLETKKKELEAAKKQVAAAEGEIKALASVFGQIKPWSAIAQDLRDRLPADIQITGILQGNPQGSGQTVTGPDAVYPRLLTIKGLATDFGQVNDFAVVLQKSSFLKPDSTKIISSERQDRKSLQTLSLPNPIDNGGTGSQQQRPLKLPGRVEFAIQTELTDVPSSELLKEIERKGTLGLLNRIEALKNKGVKP